MAADLRSAAQAVVKSVHGVATGVVGGPEHKATDFTWYVDGPTLDALREALAAEPSDPGLDRAFVELEDDLRDWYTTMRNESLHDLVTRHRDALAAKLRDRP